jgi:hypothetical protein
MSSKLNSGLGLPRSSNLSCALSNVSILFGPHFTYGVLGLYVVLLEGRKKKTRPSLKPG